jgi:hypothetical protein
MAVRRHHRSCTLALPSPEPGSPGRPGRNGAPAGYRLEQPSDVWGPVRQFLERGALLPPPSERTPGDRQFRVIGESGSDNLGNSALSGPSALRCHAKSKDERFRVWALSGPVSQLLGTDHRPRAGNTPGPRVVSAGVLSTGRACLPWVSPPLPPSGRGRPGAAPPVPARRCAAHQPRLVAR